MQYTRLTAVEQSGLMSALARMPQWTHDGTQAGVGPVSLCDIPVFLQQHDAAHMAEIQEWRRHMGIDPGAAKDNP